HRRAPGPGHGGRALTRAAMISDAVWRRACPAGQVLDLLHARVTEPYAPHVHEEYAVGVCTAGREVIRYRGTLHYAGPGSVGELVRRHASPSCDFEVRGAGRVARLVMAQLADRLVSPPALAEIAAETGLSRYQLVRSFRTEVGMPPYAWLAQHRVAHARGLLERGCRPAEAAALTGFADQAHLTRWFRRVVG